MRVVQSTEIISKVREMCIDANINLGDDVINRIKNSYDKEESKLGRDVLDILLENIRIAK
ncbi:MAG: fumarate hydratase, partial [Romboutsia sp.]|uniref:fumarate hydratase n=1 Tax=Romboutsia sp. TaxID=1965302 RepID=UPI003F2F03A3